MIRRPNGSGDLPTRRLSERSRGTDHRCGTVCLRSGFLSAKGVFFVSGITLLTGIDAGGDP
jgi:hypothetical protein